MEYFSLMNKDETILNFSAEIDEYGDTLFEEEEPEGRLPYGYQDIQSFLNGRKAPSHRKHIASLLADAGIRTDIDFILLTKALSLNDTIWVKQQGSYDTWKDVSLYRNSFNEVVAKTAFDGTRSGVFSSQTSPEYSTEGLYAKCWTRIDKEIFLVKKPSQTYGTEIYSEIMASELAEFICPHFVPYRLTEYHGKQVSICPIFTNEEIGFIPAYKFIQSRENVSKLLDIYSRYGAEDDFRRMLVFDALILNEDRHSGNYGFLFENDTGRIIGMNPVFDHNRSLLFDLKEYDKKAIRSKVPRLGGDFNILANKLLTPEIRTDLINLRGFHFQNCSGIPKERVEMAERLIHSQIEHILGGII
ncbi:MAG: HipA protein [Lachnospiraceae bacterium]|nr:HipA protein [Lachnospiraceae bacterium]